MRAGADDRLWAVVLAAGEGSRLAALTRALYGEERPKQFAALGGSRTFLQQTMDRIAPLVPPERTVVVVGDRHEAVARDQLAGYPGVEIVVQPGNRGTGPGVLLPLCHVLARAPEADVVVFPSDHYVDRPANLVEAVRRGLRTAEAVPAGVVLVGASAERPATDLGWIVPGTATGTPEARGWRVQGFVEKPPADAARALLARGALWNTMITVGRAAALWRLLRRRMPRQTRALDPYLALVGRPGASGVLREIYREIAPADLSRDVLEQAPGLGVVVMEDAGWSDCGTPERLFASLAPSRRRELAARMRGAGEESRPAAA